jgi:hypothetical protein
MNRQEEIPEKLRDAGKENPFRLPDNYFELLPDRLMKSVSEKVFFQPKRKSSFILRPLISAAAAVLFIFILYSGYKKFITNEADTNLSALSDEQLIEGNMLEEEDIIEEIVASEPEDMTGNEEDIANYLVDNDIDNYEIVSEN